MSRVNARIDDSTQAQLLYLAEATGQSVSHLVREGVSRYFADVQSRNAGPRRLLSLVGQGDSGRSDIASYAKAFVTQALQEKWRVSPAGAAPQAPAPAPARTRRRP